MNLNPNHDFPISSSRSMFPPPMGNWDFCGFPDSDSDSDSGLQEKPSFVSRLEMEIRQGRERACASVGVSDRETGRGRRI